MNLNRREAIRMGGSGVAAFFLPELLTGCPSQSEIAGLVSILGVAASTIATIQGAGDLASTITTDSQAATIAIDAWKAGTPGQEAVEAIGVLEADISLVPSSGSVAPYIALALGTAQSIITIVESQSPTAVTPAFTAHTAKVPVVALANPPKNAKQFRARWNALPGHLAPL